MAEVRELNITGSLNTATIRQDIVSFGDPNAQTLENTGIERLGGVTNLHLTETTLPAGEHAYTKSGKLLSLTGTGDTRSFSVDGVPVGTLSAYGVAERGSLVGYTDACLAQDGSGEILAISVSGGTVRYSHHSIDGTELGYREIVFANLVDVLPIATSISIVRAADIDFADTLELMVRLGDVANIISEANTSITLAQGLQAFKPIGSGVSILASVVYNGMVIVAGNSGRVSSFDGFAWKYYDGTGNGSGPFNNGTVIGTSAIFSLTVYGSNLVVSGDNGRVGHWNGNSWVNYNASGTGVSILANNGTVLGSVAIRTSAVFGSNLVVAGDNGRVGHWNGSSWVNYNASGTGVSILANNGTVLSSSDFIYSMIEYGGKLVFAGTNGRVGHWTGSSWVNYNASGTGVSILANNGTVIQAGASILSMAIYSTFLVFAGTGGTLGHWNGSSWVNYNASGTGVSILANNGTVIGSLGDINQLIVYDGKLVVLGLSGRVGHWTGSSWVNYNASGTGVYGTVSNSVVDSAVLYSTYIVTISFDSVNYISNSGPGIYYVGTGSDYIVSPFQGMTTDGSAYTYRYGNGWYLLCPVGNSTNTFYLLNPTTKASFTGVGRFAVPQVSAGKARHVITQNPTRTATTILANSLAGYTDLSTFNSTSQVYPAMSLTNDSIKEYAVGFGYADLVAGNGTARFSYLTPSPFTTSSQFEAITSNTDTLAGMYGKLSNLPGVSPAKPFEIRVGQINGVQGFLSAAIIDTGNVDALGVLLTAPGEFDENFQPDVADISTGQTILYRFNGGFRAIKIAPVVAPFERINDSLYQINTISPANVYNDQSGLLVVSNCDYNGRMLFTSSATPAATATTCASKVYNAVSNGIDVGEKLVYITGLSSSNIQIPGCRMPLINADVQGYGVDTYIAGEYSFTTRGNLAEVVEQAKVDTLYLADTTLPVPIGMTYDGGAAQYNRETLILDADRNTYTIGNDLQGAYDAFQLFGQLYLADTSTIYLAEIQGGILQGKTVVAPKTGLQYIAVSPTAAYFLSSFDNSLYTFTGGRSLDKGLRFTVQPQILSGCFSELENTLALDTSGYILWIRDGVVSKTTYPAGMVSPVYYNTARGIRIIGGNAFQYTLDPTLTSTVVPLTIKTGFYGFGSNQRGILKAFVATIYSYTKQALSVTLTVEAFDQDQWYTQTETINLTASDYSAAGYARVRIIPEYPRGLGSSLTVACDDQIVVTDASAVYEMESQASVSYARSV